MAFCLFFFFFNDTATTEIYTLSLHDALPIYLRVDDRVAELRGVQVHRGAGRDEGPAGHGRADHVGRRRVVRVPGEPADLGPAPGIEHRGVVRASVADHPQRRPVAKLVKYGHQVTAG